MRNFIELAINDIRNGENLDIYLTVLVSLALVVAGIVGIIDFIILAAGILATLSIFSMGTLSIRRSAENIQEALDGFQSRHQVFEWESQIRYKRNLVLQANTIDWITVSNHKTLAILESEITDSLKRGCQIRLLVVDPDSNTPNVLAALGHSELIPTYIKEATLKKCRKWMRTIPNCRLELRYLIGQPPFRLIIVDRSRQTGFIRLRLFVHPASKDRPTIAIRAVDDAETFGFFEDQFEKLWTISRPVPLQDNNQNVS